MDASEILHFTWIITLANSCQNIRYSRSQKWYLCTYLTKYVKTVICSIQHENWENIFLFYFKYYKSFSNYHDLFCKVFLLVCAQICDFTGQQHFFVVAITQTFLDAAFPNYKFIWWLKKKKKDLWKFQAFIFFLDIHVQASPQGLMSKRGLKVGPENDFRWS